MNLDVNQLQSEMRDRLQRSLYAAKKLPLWVWAIPTTLIVGFLWAMALCWQPTPKDEASVTVRSVDRKPVATVSIDPAPVGDYIPEQPRPRRRSRKRKKPAAQKAITRVAFPEEPSATAITPEAHWKETIAAPREIGALKRHAEPSDGGAGDGGGPTE